MACRFRLAAWPSMSAECSTPQIWPEVTASLIASRASPGPKPTSNRWSSDCGSKSETAQSCGRALVTRLSAPTSGSAV